MQITQGLENCNFFGRTPGSAEVGAIPPRLPAAPIPIAEMGRVTKMLNLPSDDDPESDPDQRVKVAVVDAVGADRAKKQGRGEEGAVRDFPFTGPVWVSRLDRSLGIGLGPTAGERRRPGWRSR